MYLHLFLRDDDDRALHDHPWDNASFLLTEGYVEVLPGNPADPRERSWKLRRTWGFWCPHGWRKFKDFVALKIDRDGRGVSSVGRGCDD